MRLTLSGWFLPALATMVWILPASAGTVAISPGCGAEGVTGVPAGGLVCTVSALGQTPTTPLTTDIVGLSSGQTVVISYLAGSVNLNSPWEDFLFNPDGSLLNPNSTSNWSVGALDYNYVKPGAQNYPTDFGGNGVNQFAGGGTNYDEYPGANCAWGFWTQNLTTDTTVPGVVRFGSLVGTLDGGLDWFYIGYGRTIGAGTAIPIPDGATLSLGVMDANYGTNSGSFQVGITADGSDVPEPSVVLLVLGGLGGIVLLRRRLA